MGLWRSSARASRRGPLRSTIERLDDRIVPDTTGVTTPAPTDPTATTTTVTTQNPDPLVTTTTGTSSTSQTNNTTGTTTTVTTTNQNGQIFTTTTTTPPEPIAPRWFAVGADANNAPRVRVYDNAGVMKSEFNAYPRNNFRGGVRAVMGDINGDGTADIVTAPGPGYQPIVKVFDGLSGQELVGFNAYDPNFRGGVYVAVGDVNGDGRQDIVTGAGDSGGSHVKVFNGLGLFPPDDFASLPVEPGPYVHLLTQFFAYDPQFAVGARVAAADVDADGKADIMTGAGFNGGPHVRVFSGADGTVIRDFMAYDTLFRGGVFVAAGDLNSDGKAELVTGMGTNGNGQIRVFDGRNNRVLREFFPNPNSRRISARLAVFDFDRDGDKDVVVSMGNKIDAFDGRTFVRTGGLRPMDLFVHTGGVFFG